MLDNADIEDWIKENGVKKLSNTDNRIAENRNFNNMPKKDAPKLDEFKKLLCTNEYITCDDLKVRKNTLYTYVSLLRGIGWVLQSNYKGGYKLVKKGSF